MEQRARRQWVGLAIMGVGFAAFFWWGVHFKVFGTDIDLKRRAWQTLGFFGWIVTIMFGAGYAHGGSRLAGKVALGMVGLMLFSALIGYLRGYNR